MRLEFFECWNCTLSALVWFGVSIRQSTCRRMSSTTLQIFTMTQIDPASNVDDQRIKRVLINDPMMGIFRHADAGYDLARQLGAVDESAFG